MSKEEVNTKSGLDFVSLGVVLKDKPGDGDEIFVWPYELYPDMTGPIDEEEEKVEVKGVNHKGVPSQQNLKGSKGVVAKWIPNGTENRVTAPNVYSRETVKLFKYRDTDDWYWESLFREPRLRGKEHVVYAWSNEPQEKEFNKDTAVVLTMSTRDKYLELKTPKNDGEFCRYLFRIDMKAGLVELSDDVGQHIKINSREGAIRIESTNLIELKSKRVVTIGHQSILEEAPKIDNNSQTTTYSASSSMTLRSPTVTNDANSVINTGSETTAGASFANPHFKYAPG